MCITVWILYPNAALSDKFNDWSSFLYQFCSIHKYKVTQLLLHVVVVQYSYYNDMTKSLSICLTTTFIGLRELGA